MPFKTKENPVRVVFTDSPGTAMPEHHGKVFALIGPFESHGDKIDLQEMIVTLLRGYNVEQA